MQALLYTKYSNFSIILLLLICIAACSQSNIQDDINQVTTPLSSSQEEQSDKIDIPKEIPAVIYKSNDLGKTWVSFANGIPNDATLSGIKQHQNKLFVSTDFHGVFVSLDGQDQWKTMNTGLPEQIDINCIEAKGEQLVIGTLNQGIFISNNEGQSWRPAAKNITNTSIRAFIQSKNKLIAGTDSGIFESSDMGDSWKPVYGTMQILGFTALNNKIYAAAHNGALMSEDNGLSWKYIYEGDALHDIGNDGQYIYAMTIGQTLLKTNNDGMSWENAQNGIIRPPNFYTNELVNQAKDIFSAQWIGIYHSVNHGKDWKKLDALPEMTAFSTLVITDFGIIAGISIR